MRVHLYENSLRRLFSAGWVIVVSLGLATTATAQGFNDVQASRSPLVLKAQGSFFVGGDSAVQTGIELGAPAGCPTCVAPGHVTNNQMYVGYTKPLFSPGVPIILIHGGGLSGKQWETTPDGRMGWEEYFVRKGHDVYVPDQNSIGRSGFNQAVYNDVAAGAVAPSAQPVFSRTSDELAWNAFRFGPSFGVPFKDEQYPVRAAEELAKQGVPSPYGVTPTPNPAYKALADLAVKAQGAVLVGHSQSGQFPVQTALTNPAGVKGMILIEGGCPAPTTTDAQITTLAKIPMLIVYGDHLDAVTPYPFAAQFAACQTFVSRVNKVGGKAAILHPPELGIHGNSHMIMQDKNNLQIADLILKWIDKNVKYKPDHDGGHH